MRKRLKSSGNHWMLLWMSVFLLSGKQTNAIEALFPASGSCTNKTTVLFCDLNGKEGHIHAQYWDSVPGYTVTGASHLTIDPQCTAMDKYLTIENSQDIRSQASDDEKYRNCKVKLILDNSTAVNLDSLFAKVVAKGSFIETIHQNQGQLEILNKSVVADLRARPQAKIENSEVKVVTEVIIEDNQRLFVEGSTIGLLKKLVLNSSAGSEISFSDINEVSVGGIELIQGKLMMENVKIDYLPWKSIIIYGGELTMTNVNLTSVQKDSIIMQGDASISLQNVMIVQNVISSIIINGDGSDAIWPLGAAPAFSSSLPTGASLAIGFIVGVITVILIIVVVYFSPCCPNLLGSNGRKEKLQYPLTAVTTHPLQTEPCPPTPLISDATKNKKDDEPTEIYENYQDVDNLNINVRGPQTGNPRYPPVPTSLPPPPVRDTVLNGDPYYDDTRDIADDQEEIYDECENVGFPPPPEHLPKNSTFPPPPMHTLPSNADAFNARPNPLGIPVREDKSFVGKARDQQQIQPSNSKPSFLHTGMKPPPPPRVANTSGKPQVSDKPSLPLSGKPGQRPQWPPQSMPDQSHFSGSLEDEEDIYEEVP